MNYQFFFSAILIFGTNSYCRGLVPVTVPNVEGDSVHTFLYDDLLSEFNKDSSWLHFEGYTEYFEDGFLFGKGVLSNGKRIGVWDWYTTKKNHGLWKIETYNDKSECIKTEYYENDTLTKIETFEKSMCINTEFYKNGVLAKTENTHAINRRRACFEDYHVGIQPPMMIDWAYPTGVTVSSFNFHADIPGEKNWKGHRAQVVAATEAGLNGFALRGGVSPFLDTEFWDEKGRVNLTPFTVNVSFTYLYRDQEYKKLENLENHRWYVGSDFDFAYMYGHARVGVFQMIGPERDRPVQFMFSIGISPNFFKLVGDGFMF